MAAEPSADLFAARLAEAKERPIVLDGGLGTLLEQRGHDVTGELWSARILVEEPGAIVAAHAEFYDAGSELAISGSYQTSYEGLAAAGIERDEATRIMQESVRLARRAAEESGAAEAGRGFVAASIGPYGAHLADGSEYRGDYGLSAKELADWHRPRIETLWAAGPDILAVETVPTAQEVEAGAKALAGTGARAWISLTPALGATRQGETLREAFRIADQSPEIVAVGVNCCHPSEVLGALEAARSVTSKPFAAYPNSGEEWDVKNRVWTNAAAFPPQLVERWLAAGVAFVGGCCRVGPAEIAEVAEVVHGGA